MDAFKGKYKRTSAEQYEEFLKVGKVSMIRPSTTQALDVNFLLRKAATVSTPEMEVTEADGTWTITTSTTLKTMQLKFKVEHLLLLTCHNDLMQLNEEFDEVTPDGREVTALVTFEDGKIVTVQKAKKDGQKSTRVFLWPLYFCIMHSFPVDPGDGWCGRAGLHHDRGR
jgi:hypothetical protein